MLVTISTTQDPVTDLGFLLHKHPEKVQNFPVAAGTAHVFYPEATARRCTAALLLEVDPVALVRGTRGRAAEAFTLGQYVNDRPYAASSLLAVALSRVFKTALADRCDARPELAAGPQSLELHIPALPCRGGPELARNLFGPLGWQVSATPVPLDPQFPGWATPGMWVIATDVSSRALELAGRRLARLADRQRDRAELFQSSLVYSDARLRGLDAAVLMEVIEHIDPPRLTAVARIVFGFAAPATVAVTTPNAEHNVRYGGLTPGAFRHRDHRFEWTRAQFRDWAAGVAAADGYAVRFLPVGREDPEVGPPTQLAIFSRTDATGTPA